MVIRVQTRDNEPVDKALRRLRKLCNNEGLTRTSKAKAYFEKPSERRRREARERQKSIRLAGRARRQDIEKLLQRRRKARKNARAAARAAEIESQATEGSAIPLEGVIAAAAPAAGTAPATAAPATAAPATAAPAPAAPAPAAPAAAAPATPPAAPVATPEVPAATTPTSQPSDG